jgi:flagellar biogenesis protein FliO
MFRWLIWPALGAVAAGGAVTLFAQSTTVPPLPTWQDKASIYLTMSEKPAPAMDAPRADVPEAVPNGTASAVHHVEAAAPTIMNAIESAATPPADNRRLALPSSNWNNAAKSTTPDQAASSADSPWRSFGSPRGTIYKIASALAIVVGLFLVFAWLLRRGARSTGSTLPADVVCVLGRVPLAARQFADLLHVGNKLVLVALSPAGPATLTEVTDPIEVDRLVGLCRQADPHSTTKAFEQVFRQLARDPAPTGFLGKEVSTGFLGNEGLPATLAPSIEAFRLPRGDMPRA